jgi:hypothetical protein
MLCHVSSLGTEGMKLFKKLIKIVPHHFTNLPLHQPVTCHHQPAARQIGYHNQGTLNEGEVSLRYTV